jgi:hypothetical protein
LIREGTCCCCFAAAAVAVCFAAVGQVNNSIARHNIKQQIKVNTINKHTAVIQVRLFVVVVVVVVIESAYKRYTIKYCCFQWHPPR